MAHKSLAVLIHEAFFRVRREALHNESSISGFKSNSTIVVSRTLRSVAVAPIRFHRVVLATCSFDRNQTGFVEPFLELFLSILLLGFKIVCTRITLETSIVLLIFPRKVFL